MLCPKCGAINLDERWRCWSCQAELKGKAPSSSPVENKSPGETRIPEDQSQFIFDDLLSTPLNREISKRTPTLQELIEKSLQNTAADTSKDVTTDRFSTGFSADANISNRRRKWVLTILTATILLLLGLGGYLIMNRVNRLTANELYSLGNQASTAGDYQKAIEFYEELVNQYPTDVLSPVARKRIAEIQVDLAFQKTHGMSKNEYIRQLLSKAERAYQRQQFTVPPGDNVLHYTKKILRIDPVNSRALALEASIIQFYDEKATEALQKRRFRSAIRFYQKILQINPNDTQTKEKLTRLQKRLP